ncbi:MAG: hypothetical protein RLZ12_196 [Bacillota bacterium]
MQKTCETSNSNKIYKIKHEHPHASKKLAKALLPTLKNKTCSSLALVALCIGTDRSTGDSLGPLVGTLLKNQNKNSNLAIFGTLEDPVHALNLEETLYHINKNYSNGYIIAIDACLGQLKNIGQIQLGLGALKPGAGVNKELTPVGQMHIAGIVNVSGFMEYFVLQNTRLNLVMNMAKVIASSLNMASQQLQYT